MPFSFKNTVSSITKKAPKKSTALIIAAILAVLVLFSIAMVIQVRHDRIQKQQAAAFAAERADAEAEQAAKITQLEASNAALTADKQALCANYTNLSTARATRALVVVPTSCAVKR